MEIKLSEQQLLTVKGMEQFAEAFANQMYYIMKNHGLDKVDGFRLIVSIEPKYDFTTMAINIGEGLEFDSGVAVMTRGKKDGKYSLLGKNSAEYELLFADEAVRSRMEEILHRKSPVPSDSLR